MSPPESVGEAEVESDAESAKREWHAWVAGALIVGGIAIIAAPEYLVPDLIIGLAPAFIIVGALGWIIKWVYDEFNL